MKKTLLQLSLVLFFVTSAAFAQTPFNNADFFSNEDDNFLGDAGRTFNTNIFRSTGNVTLDFMEGNDVVQIYEVPNFGAGVFQSINTGDGADTLLLNNSVQMQGDPEGDILNFTVTDGITFGEGVAFDPAGYSNSSPPRSYLQVQHSVLNSDITFNGNATMIAENLAILGAEEGDANYGEAIQFTSASLILADRGSLMNSEVNFGDFIIGYVTLGSEGDLFSDSSLALGDYATTYINLTGDNTKIDNTPIALGEYGSTYINLIGENAIIDNSDITISDTSKTYINVVGQDAAITGSNLFVGKNTEAHLIFGGDNGNIFDGEITIDANSILFVTTEKNSNPENPQWLVGEEGDGTAQINGLAGGALGLTVDIRGGVNVTRDDLATITDESAPFFFLMGENTIYGNAHFGNQVGFSVNGHGGSIGNIGEVTAESWTFDAGSKIFLEAYNEETEEGISHADKITATNGAIVLGANAQASGGKKTQIYFYPAKDSVLRYGSKHVVMEATDGIRGGSATGGTAVAGTHYEAVPSAYNFDYKTVIVDKADGGQQMLVKIQSLGQLQPVQETGIATMLATFDSVRSFNNTAFQRISTIQNALFFEVAENEAPKSQDPRYASRDSYLSRSTVAPGLTRGNAVPRSNRYGYQLNRPNQAWTKVWGNFANLDGDSNPAGASGFDSTTFGVTGGYDHLFGKRFAVGATVGGAWSDVSFIGNNDTQKTDSVYGSVYGSLMGRHLNIDAAFFYGFNSYTYSAAGGSTEHDASQYGAAAKISKSFGLFRRRGKLTPYVGFDYISLNEDGYTLPSSVIVGSKTSESYVFKLGLEVDCTVKTQLGLFIPNFHLGWASELADKDQFISIAANPLLGTPSYTIYGYEVPKNRVLLGVGTKYVFSNRFNAFFNYDAQFAENYGNHTVAGGVMFLF